MGIPDDYVFEVGIIQADCASAAFHNDKSKSATVWAGFRNGFKPGRLLVWNMASGKTNCEC